MDKKQNPGRSGEQQAEQKAAPRVAPGYNDRKFGEKATKEDIRSGNSTRVTRVFLDENDPS